MDVTTSPWPHDRERLFAELARRSWHLDAEAQAFASRFFDALMEQELEKIRPEDLAEDIMALYVFVLGAQEQGQGLHLHLRQSATRTCIDLYGEETPFLLNTLKLHLRAAGLPPLLVVDQPLSDDLQGRYRVALHLQIEQQDAAALTRLEQTLREALMALQRCVADFAAMREALLRESMEALRRVEGGQEREAHLEFYALISWLLQDNMLLLGMERRGAQEQRLGYLLVCPESVRDELWSTPGQFLHASLGFAQIAHRSPINHAEFCDVIIIRCRGDQGEVWCEWRLLGLYTSRMRQMNPGTIPVMREALLQLRDRCGYHPLSADARNLDRTLRCLPRERLFLAQLQELVPYLRQLVNRQQRRRVRFVWWSTPPSRLQYVSIFLPKDQHDVPMGQEYACLLQQALAAQEVLCTTLVSEFLWVRLDYVIVSGRLLEASTRQKLEQDWQALGLRFMSKLLSLLSADPDLLNRHHWMQVFNDDYRAQHSPEEAAADARLWDALKLGDALPVRAQIRDAEARQVRISVLREAQPLWLSTMLPALESLGLQVISECSYALGPGEGGAYLHELQVQWPRHPEASDMPEVVRLLSDCWQHKAWVDDFNRLILAVGLPGEAVRVLRAYAAYMQQIRQPYTQAGLATCLLRYPGLSRLLWQMYQQRMQGQRLDPAGPWQQALAQVHTLHEDSILRAVAALIAATLRTRIDTNRVSFKLSCQGYLWPRPRPWVEIFVHGLDFEGVHMRFGPLARGGIRWSDRRDDYRTEVLGLVKAQQVKNALIVPVGAKGGYVLRRQIDDAGERLQAGTQAYDDFITALLDLTDSVEQGEIKHPQQVYCHDDADPYLVVAADKGTAAYSDRANALSLARQFWLGDAFASGGEHGYDHKKLGITARGAMLSLQRHLLTLGRQGQSYTCLGIGDMSGDVFGNGMLLDPHMQLLAAFNHAYIFIDPTPGPQALQERQRLFALPRSNWNDYQSSCLSPGGAIYARQDKSLQLSPQACAALGLEQALMSADELVRALLCSQVDVIWNGGIGTYVKASTEHHAEVGDPANDAVRANACDLRARIICEGGNLGLTQAARVEFALAGGLCHTDFIDNSAGVDCSDREVNIKLFLQESLRSGRLQMAERNALLASWQDQVAARVLADNQIQAFLLALAAQQQAARHHEFFDFISHLEQYAGLDRQIEALPDQRQWQKRLQQEQWLTRPELALLLAYAKNSLKSSLAELKLADDEVCRHELIRAFPAALHEQYGEALLQHPLRHALVATELANDWVHKLGITSLQRLRQKRDVQLTQQARAFIVVRQGFALEPIWAYLLDGAPIQAALLWAGQAQHYARRAVLWMMGEAEISTAAIPAEPLLDLLIAADTRVSERFAFWRAQSPSMARAMLSLEQAVQLLELNKLTQLAHVEADQVLSIQRQLELTLGLEPLLAKMQAQVILNTWQAQALESTVESWRMLRRQLILQALRRGGLHLDTHRLAEWQGLCSRLRTDDYQQQGLYTVLTHLLQGFLKN